MCVLVITKKNSRRVPNNLDCAAVLFFKRYSTTSEWMLQLKQIRNLVRKSKSEHSLKM